MNTTAVEAFTSEGFSVLRGLFSSDDIAQARQLRDEAVQDWCFSNGTADPPIVVGDLLERYPRSILRVVADPDILELAEAIMGPFVQLDSAVLHASPVCPQAERGRVVCWHRDRFGSFPVGAYTRPLTLICFIYLQEMNDDTGPLRVVPRSHREPVQIPESDVTTPHPDEVLITTSPGDAVMIHNNLLHSGTANVSSAERQFLGISYTLSCMGSRYDTFDGPNCRALLATAQRMRDRRLMRLLGDDDQILARQNTGFTTASTQWSRWHDEDQRYASEAAAVRREVADVWGWSS